MYDCMCVSPPMKCAYVVDVSYKKKAKNDEEQEEGDGKAQYINYFGDAICSFSILSLQFTAFNFMAADTKHKNSSLMRMDFAYLFN